MEKIQKLQELTKQSEEYAKGIEAGQKLLTALEDYKGNTINKTFFEKYFSSRYTEEWRELPAGVKIGDIRKDWKGNAYTDFKLSEPRYSFQKGFYMDLAGNNKVEDIESRERKYIIDKVFEKVSLMKEWKGQTDKKIEKYNSFDEVGFLKAYNNLISEYDMQGEEWFLREVIR
jgi:hypothetical protein